MTGNLSWAKIAKRIRVPLGFAFATIYLWLANPTPTSVAIGLAFVILGVLVRAVASGHVQKNEQLAVSGPYAYSRNPLYLGSLILAVGFAVTGRNWWIGSGIVIFFLAIYLPVIRAEEDFLRSRFPEFGEYAQHVPRLLPRLTPFGNRRSAFSSQLYWKHREYNAAVGACAIMAILAAKMLWHSR